MMAPRVLVTGGGRAGSWQIRGEQLGRAIGAHVQPLAADVSGFDIAVLVKRSPADLVERVRRAGVFVVWDIVDAWPQPAGNHWSRQEAMTWLRNQVASLRPHAIVAATQAMAADCVEFGLPVLALSHHARPGLPRNPIRDQVRTVAYEGSTRHLGRWEDALRIACDRRGWQFVVNPACIADADIVVALRDASGYPARAWKSGVKLANAQASGTPIICAREHGCAEGASGGECWVDTLPDLLAALDTLRPAEERRRRAALLAAAPPRLDDIAAAYKDWLECICETAPS